jgi:hypothetical protein
MKEAVELVSAKGFSTSAAKRIAGALISCEEL